MINTFRSEEFNYEVVLGKFANQADGAVWFKQGGTIVLATVVSSPSEEFPGFLPLTIEYRELFSAAGKIPGGYHKREGKATEHEVLTGRIIDRSVRPLFPSNFFQQTQIITTVYSIDPMYAPHNLALLASSLALTISDIPFMGPVGVVEVARLNGQWIFNPTHPEAVKSDVRLIIAGTEEGVCMVEGSANEISEQDFLHVLNQSHAYIKKQIDWQLSIQKQVGRAKNNDATSDGYDWNTWQQRIEQQLTEDKVRNLYNEDKVERASYLKKIKEEFAVIYKQQIEETKVPQSVIDYIFESVLQQKITELIFVLGKRIDHRDFTTIRNISVDVGLLPYAHGSALFTRGRTQALVSVTLGSGQDEQRTESLMEEDVENGSFMLHYNFPPYSVGEVRPMRGPGRREVGHGALAASALKYVRPSKEEFPYTIRLVADILESDGSTSMATTCGSTMALMQAGVPIKAMVSGIAMGLLKNKKGDFRVLSDISGFEDAFGLMDLKVTGTDKGITAIQMDIKYKGGLTQEIMAAAFEQARQGRLHILGEMRKVMTKPNAELSPLVPKVHSFKIDVDKIGAVIGTGGKTIREITQDTKTSIDIEPTGMVKIFGASGEGMDKAIRWVKTLTGLIEAGAIYEGKIKRIADFGLFVELVPGVMGLVHISNIPKEKQKSFTKDFKIDDMAKVVVLDYDDTTGRISLKITE